MSEPFEIGVAEAAILTLERRVLYLERELAMARLIIKTMADGEGVVRWSE